MNYEKGKGSENTARSRGVVQKILCLLMYIVWQVAKRERRRVGLEENLPSLIIPSIIFPVSKGDGKRLVHGARKQGVVAGMLGVRSACFAVCGFSRVEAPSVFARRGVVCEGAGHTANGRYIITRHSHEEVFT